MYPYHPPAPPLIQSTSVDSANYVPAYQPQPAYQTGYPSPYPYTYAPYYQPPTAYQTPYQPLPAYPYQPPALVYQNIDRSRDLVFNPVINESDDDTEVQTINQAVKAARVTHSRPHASRNQSVNLETESVSTIETQSVCHTGNQSSAQQSITQYLGFPDEQDRLTSLTPIIDDFAHDRSISETNDQQVLLPNGDMFNRCVSTAADQTSNQPNAPRVISPFTYIERSQSFNQPVSGQTLAESRDRVDSPSPILHWQDQHNELPPLQPRSQPNAAAPVTDPTQWLLNHPQPRSESTINPSVNPRLLELRSRVTQACEAQRFWTEKAQSAEDQWRTFHAVEMTLPVEQRMEIINVLTHESQQAASMIVQWEKTCNDIARQYNEELANIERMKNAADFDAYYQAVRRLNQGQATPPRFVEPATSSDSANYIDYASEHDQQQQKRKRESPDSPLKQPKKAKASKRQRDPRAPQRPLTSFFLFHQARLSNIDLSPSNVTQMQASHHGDGKRQTEISGQMWNAMSAEAKAPYEQMFRENSIEYQRQMADFERLVEEEKSQSDDDNSSLSSMRSHSGNSSVTVVLPTPAVLPAPSLPRARTAYRMFVDEYLHNHEGQRTPRELKLEARRMWENDMGSEAKRPYQVLHQEAKRQYDAANREAELKAKARADAMSSQSQQPIAGSARAPQAPARPVRVAQSSPGNTFAPTSSRQTSPSG